VGKCRHTRQEVEPQRHVWRGGKYIRTVAAQVFCADCKVWLYEKPIHPDGVPLNALQRREARIDDSQASKRPTRTNPAQGS
jgi:hypothetical protein